MTDENVRRAAIESPVHGAAVVAEVARLRRKFLETADQMHAPGYMQETHKASGYSGRCSACYKANTILKALT